MFRRVIALLAIGLGAADAALADVTFQPLPFSQDWSNTALITADDDWSGVPGVFGYRGDNLTSTTGVDPQTLTADAFSPVDVNANQTDPLTFVTGGVTEFELANPSIALTGSGTADAPYIMIRLDAGGQANIRVSYVLRDLEGAGGSDNSVQQVALQYRTAESPQPWTNVPAGYVADATDGPGLTKTTPVSVTLPPDANGAATLQIRIITTNATGNDEWVGVDDILVTAEALADFVDVTTGPLADEHANWQGVAWGDYDGDGDPDVFLPCNGCQEKLLRNDGGVLADAAQPFGSIGYCAAWGDYDNDGYPDLYVGSDSDTLYRNEGDGTFATVTTSAGQITAGITWVDYDNDGDLDFYLAKFGPDELFRNDGGAGFVDATHGPIGEAGSSWSVVAGDLDGDADQDLYLVNNGSANRLFRNDGGTFVDATVAPLGDDGDKRGAAAADFDNDGDLDIYLAMENGANKLFRNEGGGAWSDVAATPINDSQYSTDAAWGDYDNDGLLDLYLCNPFGTNRLFKNLGGGAFADATTAPLAIGKETAAWADYDGDGDLDLLAAGTAGRLLRNDTETENHWLHADLVGVVSNRSAIGARVRLVAGGMTQTRFVGTESGRSQNSLTVEFGLGSATSVDTLQIFWPSGIQQDTIGVAVDQKIELIEHQAVLGVDGRRAPAVGIALTRTTPNPFTRLLRIDYTLAADARARLTVHDLLGRRVATLADGVEPAGRHSASWAPSGQSLRPGVYVVRLESLGTAVARKVVLTH